MPHAPYRSIPLSHYRANCAALTHWVQHMGGRLWLTRHGKFIAAVVPVHHCERLEQWDQRSLAEERLRIEKDYQRWKRVKAVTREGGDVVWE